jgi:hypothetical protein
MSIKTLLTKIIIYSLVIVGTNAFAATKNQNKKFILTDNTAIIPVGYGGDNIASLFSYLSGFKHKTIFETDEQFMSRFKNSGYNKPFVIVQDGDKPKYDINTTLMTIGISASLDKNADDSRGGLFKSYEISSNEKIDDIQIVINPQEAESLYSNIRYLRIYKPMISSDVSLTMSSRSPYMDPEKYAELIMSMGQTLSFMAGSLNNVITLDKAREMANKRNRTINCTINAELLKLWVYNKRTGIIYYKWDHNDLVIESKVDNNDPQTKRIDDYNDPKKTTSEIVEKKPFILNILENNPNILRGIFR